MTFIKWCNINEGFLSIVLSLMAFIISSIAIIITVLFNNKQKEIERTNINISLLDRRIEIYDYFLDIFSNINDEMLRITNSYSRYEEKESLCFYFLQKIDFCKNPLYINDDLFFQPEFVIKKRIGKSIFDSQFESVINAYIDKAIKFANAKVQFEIFVEKYGVNLLKEKLGSFFWANNDMNVQETEPKMFDQEFIELFKEMPNHAGISKRYTKFLVCDKLFEKYIEKQMDIDFIK